VNQEILKFIRSNQSDAKSTALAIVVNTWGSAPRPIGSMMVVNQQMQHVGSVSGGCVEADVIGKAQQVISSGNPRLEKYSVSDDTAFGVGLACGGDMEVFIALINDEVIDYLSKFTEFNLTQYYTIDCEELKLSWGKSDLHKNRSIRKIGNSKELFFGVLSPTPELILIGGGEISVEVSKIASIMGYNIIVIDPRKAFNAKDRFPEGVNIIPEWPDDALEEIDLNQNCVLVALSHDPKLDDPALKKAVSSEAFYIGALGSSRTHKKRLERLGAIVSNPKSLMRIKSPVGLDINAETAQEIALSILAEIIQYRKK
jgi:xanthine dehydrogenase accessory factor